MTHFSDETYVGLRTGNNKVLPFRACLKHVVFEFARLPTRGWWMMISGFGSLGDDKPRLGPRCGRMRWAGVFILAVLIMTGFSAVSPAAAQSGVRRAFRSISM
jgi:hypothetical protein